MPSNSAHKSPNSMVAMDESVFGHDQNRDYEPLKQEGIGNAPKHHSLSEKADGNLIDSQLREINFTNYASSGLEKENTAAKEETPSAREIPTGLTNRRDSMGTSNSHNKDQHKGIPQKEQEKQDTSAKALNISDTALSAKRREQSSSSIIVPYQEQSPKKPPSQDTESIYEGWLLKPAPISPTYPSLAIFLGIKIRIFEPRQASAYGTVPFSTNKPKLKDLINQDKSKIEIEDLPYMPRLEVEGLVHERNQYAQGGYGWRVTSIQEHFAKKLRRRREYEDPTWLCILEGGVLDQNQKGEEYDELPSPTGNPWGEPETEPRTRGYPRQLQAGTRAKLRLIGRLPVYEGSSSASEASGLCLGGHFNGFFHCFSPVQDDDSSRDIRHLGIRTILKSFRSKKWRIFQTEKGKSSESGVGGVSLAVSNGEVRTSPMPSQCYCLAKTVNAQDDFIGHEEELGGEGMMSEEEAEKLMEKFLSSFTESPEGN